MSIEIRRLCKMDEWCLNNLSNINHISTVKDIPNLYIKYGLWNKGQYSVDSIEKMSTIVNWSEERTTGDVPDVQVYLEDGNIVAWEPYIEYLIRVEYLRNYYNENLVYTFGYVDGQMTHLGPYATQGIMSSNNVAGYQLYQNFR